MVCCGWIACFCYPLLPVGWSIVTTLLANLTVFGILYVQSLVFSFSPLMCWIWCGQNKVRHGDPTATWSRWPTAIARSSKSCTATSEKIGASATRRDNSMASQSGSNALDKASCPPALVWWQWKGASFPYLTLMMNCLVCLTQLRFLARTPVESPQSSPLL